MNEQYRQGDVLLIRVDCEIPPDAKPIPREDGKIVLAHGEATGHAHTIKNRAAKFFETKDRRILALPRPAILEHHEHARIDLPTGTYEVIRQREYSPEAIRNVAD